MSNGNKVSWRGRFYIFSLLLGMLPALVEAADPGGVPSITKEALEGRFGSDAWDTKAPVGIQSQKMDVDFDKHRIVFKGSVHVTQADFSLVAQEVVAVFGEDANDILKVLAKGDVTVKKGDKIAWGQEAVYDRKKASLLLSGKPFLQQGKNKIKGREIRVLLDEDRMEILGDVEAEFRLENQGESGQKEQEGG